MFEIKLDSESIEPSVVQDGFGVIRLTLSPTTSLDTALETCHHDLVKALHEEFQSIFSDRSVARTYEVKNGTVVIRRA